MKLYRILWVRDDKQTRGVLFPGPLTHEQACTVLTKVTAYPWRRTLLEEINGLPEDYESCGECGFDHEYEPNEAHLAHAGETI